MSAVAARLARPAALLDRLSWPLRALAVWTVLGVVAAMLVVFLAGQAAGYERLAVMSGSMEPAVSTGDVVLSKHIRPIDARVGDVVTFKDPDNPKRLITHRVRSLHAAGPKVRFVTKGDANNAVERWNVPASGSVGRVEHRLPRLGYVFSWFGSTGRKLLLLLIPALLLAALEIRAIWRREEPEPVEDPSV